MRVKQQAHSVILPRSEFVRRQWLKEFGPDLDPSTPCSRLSLSALVLNGDQLRGVFSERDLMKRVVLERCDPDRTPVGRVMSTEVATIDEAASLEDAMEAMQSHSCRHLPVTRDGTVVAFLSMRDLMNFELAQKTEEIHHMRAYISNA